MIARPAAHDEAAAAGIAHGIRDLDAPRIEPRPVVERHGCNLGGWRHCPTAAGLVRPPREHRFERREEPVHVRVGVVEMGCDPHRASTHAHVDLLAGERIEQPGRDPSGESQPQEVAGPSLRGLRAETERPRALGDRRSSRAQCVGDVPDAPGEDLLQRSDRHRHQVEIRHLAHVESPCAGSEFVAVVDESGEVLRSRARRPAVLERLAALPVGVDVQKTERIRTHQPLVARRRRESGLHPRNVDGQGAGGLREIERDRSAHRAHAFADRLQVEQRSVGPAAMGQGGNGGAFVDRGENRAGQIAVGGIHGDDLGAGARRGRPPRIEVGRKLVRKQHDGLPGPKRQVAGGDRHAVARGGDDGDVVRAGIDDAGEEAACTGGLGEEIGDGDLPRARLAPHPPQPRLDH